MSKQYAVTMRSLVELAGKAKVVDHPKIAPTGPFAIGTVDPPTPPL